MARAKRVVEIRSGGGAQANRPAVWIDAHKDGSSSWGIKSPGRTLHAAREEAMRQFRVLRADMRRLVEGENTLELKRKLAKSVEVVNGKKEVTRTTGVRDD